MEISFCSHLSSSEVIVIHFFTWHVSCSVVYICSDMHDDVIKWKHFPRYWPFVRGIHRSPGNSPHKGQWRGALMVCLICARINGWVNNGEAGDLIRHPAHYDVIVMDISYNGVTHKLIFHQIWFTMEKSFVKIGPCVIFKGYSLNRFLICNCIINNSAFITTYQGVGPTQSTLNTFYEYLMWQWIKMFSGNKMLFERCKIKAFVYHLF